MREPNKDYWQGNEVTGYERKQRLLVPRKDELLDTIVENIPFDIRSPIRVLDLGTGQGALAERVLHRFENAHVTALDASGEMLNVLEKRLKGQEKRLTIVEGDFNTENWHSS